MTPLFFPGDIIQDVWITSTRATRNVIWFVIESWYDERDVTTNVVLFRHDGHIRRARIFHSACSYKLINSGLPS